MRRIARSIARATVVVSVVITAALLVGWVASHLSPRFRTVEFAHGLRVMSLSGRLSIDNLRYADAKGQEHVAFLKELRERINRMSEGDAQQRDFAKQIDELERMQEELTQRPRPPAPWIYSARYLHLTAAAALPACVALALGFRRRGVEPRGFPVADART